MTPGPAYSSPRPRAQTRDQSDGLQQQLPAGVSRPMVCGLPEDLTSPQRGTVWSPAIPFAQEVSAVSRASHQCLGSISSRPDGQEAASGCCRETPGGSEWNSCGDGMCQVADSLTQDSGRASLESSPWGTPGLLPPPEPQANQSAHSP